MNTFWKSVLALLTASILLLSFAACNGDETSDPAQSGSESTGAESGVKEIAGDYSIDISGAGMALTLYLRIEENGNFKFSNSKEFETDKNSGTVRAADSGYLMVYSTVNGEASTGKTTSFEKQEDGSLKFTSALLYGSVTLVSPWENEDTGESGHHTAVKLTEGGDTQDDYKVEAGLYYVSYEKESGMGGSVTYEYYLNLREDGKFTAFVKFAMMGSDQFAYDYGTYSIMGAMCRLTSEVYKDYEDDTKDLTESLVATSETEFEADVKMSPFAKENDTVTLAKIEAPQDAVISFTGTHDLSMGEMSVTFELALTVNADGAYTFTSTSSMGGEPNVQNGFIGLSSMGTAFVLPDEANEGVTGTFDSETGELNAKFSLGAGSPQDVKLTVVTE